MATKREWDSVINHWKRISSGKLGKYEGVGPEDCAFCRRYLVAHNCRGCPIFEETNMRGCIGTPYEDVSEYFDKYNSDDISKDLKFMRQQYWRLPISMRLAKKELDFLLALRKKVRGD